MKFSLMKQIYKEEVHKKKAHILEAPITGGMDALKKGQMVVYVGGDEKIAEIVKPLLEVLYFFFDINE